MDAAAEKKRIYGQEYRARKKRETAAASAQTSDAAPAEIPAAAPPAAARRLVVFATPDYTHILRHSARYARVMRALLRRTAFLAFADRNAEVVAEFARLAPAYAARALKTL